MTALAGEITAIRDEIDAVKRTLSHVREEAIADDGVIDDEEAAEIEDLEEQIDYLTSALQDLEAEAAQDQEDTGSEGGFLSGLIDGAQDIFDSVTETIGDAVSGQSEERSEAENGSDTAEQPPEPGGGADTGADTENSGAGSSIAASVGDGGQNDQTDVSTVQTLLNRAGGGLAIDGLIGPKTIGGIRAFQESNGCTASGLIAPGDDTWNVLKSGGRANQLADAAEGLAEDAGSWLEDAAGTVADTFGDITDSVSELLSGSEELSDEEEIQSIHDELLELEREADAL